MSKKKNKSKKRQQDVEVTVASDAVQAQAATSTKHRDKSKGSPSSSGGKKRHKLASDNPLLRQQQAFLDTLTTAERDSFFSETLVDPERRAALWMQQADLGETLVNQYAWATPNPQAIHILRHFSPLIEIGCGANAYWCILMKQAGIDVTGYDTNPGEGGTIAASSSSKQQTDFTVQAGGPQVLSLPENAKHALFLCYPDESDEVVMPQSDAGDDEDDQDGNSAGVPISMGAACLGYFQGDYVIHVGELFSEANLSMEQAPWGRSSSPEFQQQLAAEYHCLLRVALPNWLHVRDSLSVWKRSETCTIVFAADEEEESDAEDEEVQYRHIPVKERLPTNAVAPCLAHLLHGSGDKKTEQRNTTTTETVAKASTSTEMNSKDYECPW
jgi:hypothetical protein